MTVEEAAWLAGFFDGEGSIGIHKAGRSKKYTAFQLSISNTCLASLNKCAKITGCGSVLSKSMKSRLPHHKPQWVWAVKSQRNIESILRQIRPFLIIKDKKADEFFNEWSDL